MKWRAVDGTLLLDQGKKGVYSSYTLVAMDGRTVDSVAALLARLDDRRIGDRVTLRIWRASRELDIDVVLQGGT